MGPRAASGLSQGYIWLVSSRAVPRVHNLYRAFFSRRFGCFFCLLAFQCSLKSQTGDPCLRVSGFGLFQSVQGDVHGDADSTLFWKAT